LGYSTTRLPETQSEPADAEDAARRFNLKLLVLNASTEREIDEAFATFAQRQVSALVVGLDPYLLTRRDQVIGLAARYSIPAIYGQRESVNAGGLMSYGNSLTEAYRHAGLYVGRILRGAKPTDLPIDRLTKFEFVINLTTAKALGLTVPASFLSLADDLIEWKLLMSGIGPKRTFHDCALMSAFGGKADIDQLLLIDLDLRVHALVLRALIISPAGTAGFERRRTMCSPRHFFRSILRQCSPCCRKNGPRLCWMYAGRGYKQQSLLNPCSLLMRSCTAPDRSNGTDDCPSTLSVRASMVEVSMTDLRETGDPGFTTQIDTVGWMVAVVVVLITAVAGMVAYHGWEAVVEPTAHIVASR
jgi:hypothetical protein